MSEVKIPTSADEAAAMVLIGMSWLENNAPERLTELHREMKAEAGRAGFVAGALEWGDIGFSCLVDDSANQYAEQIRQGEVE